MTAAPAPAMGSAVEAGPEGPLAAVGVQLGREAPHRRYFNHNAVYHLIQALSLFLFYRSGRRLVARNARAR